MKAINQNVRGEVHGESLSFTEDVEEDIDTETHVVVEGLLLPKQEVSRNNVLYDWGRIKEIYEQLVGKKVYYNHNIEGDEPPTGRIVDTWLKEEDDEDGKAGWYYKAALNKRSRYTQSVLDGDLDKVSIQVMADKAEQETTETGNTYTRAFIKSIKEVSLVGVPGFTQTSLEVALNEAFQEQDQEETGQTTGGNPGAMAPKLAGDDDDEEELVEAADRVQIKREDSVVIEVEGEERGLVVESDGEKYHVAYWYEDTEKIMPVEVYLDGVQTDSAETITLGLHADEEEIANELAELAEELYSE